MRLAIQKVNTLPNQAGEGDRIVDPLTFEPIIHINFRHRTDGLVQLRFLEGATAVSAGSIELTVKHVGDFSGDSVAFCDSFSLVGPISTGYYEGYPSFDMQPLNDLFNTGTQKYIDFGIEITWLTGGHRNTTMPATARIWNNYLKAADSGIVPPIGVTGLSVVTGVLNGPGLGITTTEQLADYTTANISAGRIMVIPETSAEVGYTMWYLRAGDEEDDPSNGIVRPTDYADTTNEKVWVGIL